MNCFESNSVEFQGGKQTNLVKSFTKQGKLAWECNSKTVPKDVEISAGDLLITTQIKKHWCNM